MRRASTSYLLTCAVIGVAGGLLLVPANWLSTLLFATVPLLSVVLAGVWLLPAVVALRLLQRPGAGLLVGLISGLVLVPFSGYGFGSVATNLWWAFFAEVAFLVVIYRWWTLPQHFAGALIVGIVYPIMAGASFDVASMSPGVFAGFVALTIAGAAAGTAIGIAIAAGLRKAGVGKAARRPAVRAAAA